MGGKQKIARHIVKYIPDHMVYVEPFFGSGAVFFEKGYKNVSDKAHYREVVGDINGDITNFFEQLRSNYKAMKERLKYFEYSENLHQNSKTNSEYYSQADDITKACLFLFNILNSFGGDLNSGFAYSKYAQNHVAVFKNRKNNLDHYADRLTDCYIFNKSYDILIDRFDSKYTFFYFDPPYFETTKYKGQEIDYNKFGDDIKNINGKWILSHYRDKWLETNFPPDKYNYVDIQHYCSVQKSNGEQRKGKNVKECIVMNYDIADCNNNLFWGV
jgi:DNA adenine methylase